MFRRGGFGKGMRRRNVVTPILAAKFQSFLNQHPADVSAAYLPALALFASLSIESVAQHAGTDQDENRARLHPV